MAKKAPAKKGPQKADSKKGTFVLFGIVGLLVIVIIGAAVWSTKKDTSVAATGPKPAAATANGAIPVGSGPATVDVYEDFQCPACGAAEKGIGPRLQKLAAENKATINYHMMSFLGPESERAAAAAFCASDAGKFEAYHNYLFAHQPQEHTGGYTTDELIAAGKAVGVGPGFDQCVKDAKYAAYVTTASDAAGAEGIKSTPTFRVNGKDVPLENNWDTFYNKIVAALGIPAASTPAVVPSAAKS